MNQAQYLAALQKASTKPEKNDVVKQFWSECSTNQKLTLELFSPNFIDRHLSTLSDNAAKKMARFRSNAATRDFVSTLLSEGDAPKLVQYCAKHVIPWIVQNDFVFRNYLIDLNFQSTTIKVVAAAEGGVQSSGPIKPVIGIDAQALIVHFHGPAEYAREDHYVEIPDRTPPTWKAVKRA